MTVSSSTNKIIGTGNGVTTSWPFSFKVLDADHLVVTYTDAVGDETTLDVADYVVILNADQDASPGGTVTYSPAIADGTKLTILRSVPYTQAIDLKNQGGFFPEVLERGFDLVVMQVQQIKEQLGRAFKLSPSQSAIGELEATDASRANTILGFGPTGLLTLFTGVASSAVSLALQPVISAASLALGRSAMAVPGLGDNNTYTGSNTFNGSVPFGNPGSLLASLQSWIAPGHRLTLTSGVDVTTADVTGGSAATIFWTPKHNNLSPIYDGTAWRLAAIPEKSFVLDTTNFLSGKNHDVFLDYNAGTPRLLTSPAWSSEMARADALGRDATYGFRVNNASITCRISNNGGTVVKSAGTLLYLGTFRCAANGQSEDSAAKRFLWNMYNRVPRSMRAADSTDSWTYNSTSLRQARGQSTNQLDFVRGLDEDVVIAIYTQVFAGSGSGDVAVATFGLDSTTTQSNFSSQGTHQLYAGGVPATNNAHFCGLPGLGRHFLAALESGASTGVAVTFAGDSGGTAPRFLVSGWMPA